MPIIKVDWTVKKTSEEKKEFIEKVTDIVSSSIKAPREVVNVLIREIPLENVRCPEAVFTITWSKNPDRNQEAKNNIISVITDMLLDTTDLDPGKIVFFFFDLDGCNVGVAGKTR